MKYLQSLIKTEWILNLLKKKESLPVNEVPIHAPVVRRKKVKQYNPNRLAGTTLRIVKRYGGL